MTDEWWAWIIKKLRKIANFLQAQMKYSRAISALENFGWKDRKSNALWTDDERFEH